MKPRWLEISEGYLREGVAEIAGAAAHPEILKALATTQLPQPYVSSDETAWCAAWTNRMIELAGLTGTGSARARAWLRWGVGVSLEHVPLGAIGIFSRGRGPQPGPEVIEAPGHVGFLVGLASPTEVLVHGANQGNQLCVRSYALERLLGVRWAA